MHSIIKRSQHSGDIPERGVLLPPFSQRACRLSLEIGDDEIILGQQHLGQVIIAMQPRLERAHGGRCAGIDAFQ